MCVCVWGGVGVLSIRNAERLEVGGRKVREEEKEWVGAPPPQ